MQKDFGIINPTMSKPIVIEGWRDKPIVINGGGSQSMGIKPGTIEGWPNIITPIIVEGWRDIKKGYDMIEGTETI